ncbi:hypothetical protein OG338_17755 [Streptomyces sp. NBC_00726]|uniref:hypothetical protein n=1 Tax=Streptomyces sp. NBC_00726 TaxID=2903674 RepID=UPI00386C839C
MKSDDVLVLRRKGSVAAGVVLIIALHVVNLMTVITIDLDPGVSYGMAVLRLGVATGLACTVAWSAVVRSRVVLTRGEGIRVINPLGRAWMPWTSFVDARRSRSGLEIRGTGDFVVHAWAFSSSMLDMGRTDRARSTIDQAAAYARHTGELGSGSPGRSWSLPWRAALVLIATETAMGWLAHQMSS